MKAIVGIVVNIENLISTFCVMTLYRKSALAIILFLCLISCKESKEKLDHSVLNIKIDKEAVFVDGKRVAEVADIAEQNSILVEVLDKELKLITEKKPMLINVEPSTRYDVVYKVAATGIHNDYNDITFSSEINGEKYVEKIYVPEKEMEVDDSASIPLEPQYLNLTVLITSEYFEIWASAGSLPKIFFKSVNGQLWVLHKESEEDPGKLLAILDSTKSDVMPYSPYDKLDEFLILIHDRFIDDPYINRILIAADEDTDFSKIIQTMQRGRMAGFFKINFTLFSDRMKFSNVNSPGKRILKQPLYKRNFSTDSLMKDENFKKEIDKVLKAVADLEKSKK